jgi:hypothetical protein
MPAYIHCFSAPNFAASLWQNFDSPTDTDFNSINQTVFFDFEIF